MLKHILKARTDFATWWFAPALNTLLFVLLVFLLPTQLGIHFWPDWSFINGLRIDYFSPTIYLTDIVIIAIVIPAYAGIYKNRFRVKPGMTLVFLFALINIYFSISPELSIYKWLKFFEFLALAFWLKANWQKNWQNIFIKIFSVSMVLQSLIAIGQFIKQSSLGGAFYFLGERNFSAATAGIAQIFFNNQLFLRPYGTFPHPNVLAFFILVAIILNKNKLLKIFFILILILTGSRATVIGLIISCLGTLFQKNLPEIFWSGFYRNAKKLPFVFGFLTFAVSLGIFWPIVFQNVNLDKNLQIRSLLLTSSLQTLQDNFLFGTGLGTEILNHLKFSFYSNSQPLAFLQPVHNIFLLIFSETGIIGFFAVILAVSRILNNKLILLILFLGSFDHYFLTVQQGQLLTTFIITLAIMNQWENTEKSPKILSSKSLVKVSRR